jgi:hypothetical protein
MKLEPDLQCALYIPQNPFDSFQMKSSMGMKELSYFVNCEQNVRSS